MAIPSEVRDDFHDKSCEHGQRHASSRNPVDQIAAHELVEYEAAMVGKKVHRQPEQVCLCEHSHAERVSESVGAVIEEKKQKDPNMCRRGVRNVAVEAWVRTAVPVVGIEVISNGGNCERGGDARE